MIYSQLQIHTDSKITRNGVVGYVWALSNMMAAGWIACRGQKATVGGSDYLVSNIRWGEVNWWNLHVGARDKVW